MSTRSIIVVHGQDLYSKNTTVRLYKHSNGYPTGTLPVIGEAIEMAQKNKYEEYGTKKERVNVTTLVGKLIGAGTSEYGMGIKIDNYEDDKAIYEEPFKKAHLGIQGDLEWVYIIDLSKKTVSILGGGYTGKRPDTFKLADPFGRIECLKDEYKKQEIEETKKVLQGIKDLGFKLKIKGGA